MYIHENLKKTIRKHAILISVSIIISLISSISWDTSGVSIRLILIINIIGIYLIWLGTEFIFRKVYKAMQGFKIDYLIIALIFILSFIYSLVILYLGNYAIGYFAFSFTSFFGVFKTALSQLTISNIVFLLLLPLLPFFFYSFEHWKKSAVNEEKMKSEALKYQYETLKSQVNPHFLFNNLNSLSALMHKDIKQADKFIKTFSEIYRYVLAHRDVDFVHLKNEIEFVEAYFYLQSIRDTNKVQMDIIIDDYKYKIIPVSLQLLIENAIKHNSATNENPLKISISIENSGWISVKNNLQLKPFFGNSEKVGLENLKARYFILLQKEVIIEQTDDEFIVKIPLIRNENKTTDI